MSTSTWPEADTHACLPPRPCPHFPYHRHPHQDRLWPAWTLGHFLPGAGEAAPAVASKHHLPGRLGSNKKYQCPGCVLPQPSKLRDHALSVRPHITSHRLPRAGRGDLARSAEHRSSQPGGPHPAPHAGRTDVAVSCPRRVTGQHSLAARPLLGRQEMPVEPTCLPQAPQNLGTAPPALSSVREPKTQGPLTPPRGSGPGRGWGAQGCMVTRACGWCQLGVGVHSVG